MKVLVCGGRDFINRVLFRSVMNLEHEANPIEMIIQGGAGGADSLAKQWASRYGVHCAEVEAMWSTHGRFAGPRRNKAMLTLKPDLVIAFPGGRGTADMVRQAKAAGVTVKEISQ